MLYFFIRMWSWQDKALVQTPICIVYMWQNSEYQPLLCCFYILWFLTPFLCHPQHWAPRSFQRASLIHWISSLLMCNRTKSKSHPLQYKATRKPFWCYLTPPPNFPPYSDGFLPDHTPCTVRIKSFHHIFMKFEGTNLIWHLLLHVWHLSEKIWVAINKRCSEYPWNFWGLESVHSKKSSPDKQVEWEQALSRDPRNHPPYILSA